jgi:5-methylcytosine-specific restriction endonuclease McrA
MYNPYRARQLYLERRLREKGIPIDSVVNKSKYTREAPAEPVKVDKPRKKRANRVTEQQKKERRAKWQREFYWKFNKYAKGHGDYTTRCHQRTQETLLNRANQAKHAERLEFYRKFFEHKLFCAIHPDTPAVLSGIKRRRYRCPKCRALHKTNKHHSRARGKLTYQLRDAIYKNDGHRCVKCGSNKQLTIDHIQPIAVGGTNCPSNLQTLCNRCNGRKRHHIDIRTYQRPVYYDLTGKLAV